MVASGTEMNNLKEGKYIYCIIQNSNFMDFGPLGIGERGDKVYTICFQDISAVVSDSPIKKYSALRKDLIPHESVIEEVMKTFTVLPVRFSTIAEDEDKVKMILEGEHGRFVDLLKYMEGKKELGLKAIFKSNDVIYKDILEKYEDIKALKEKFAILPPEVSYYQRVEIGKMVESALKKEKEICKNDILKTLSPLAVDVKTIDTYGNQMIINSAFLVEKHKEAEFDQNVNEYMDKYGYKINFKYVGTVPPFNFVNLVINVGEY